MSVYAALGRGASQTVLQDFPILTPISLPAYVVSFTIDTLNP